MTIISPSILSLDFTQLNTQMEAVNASQAQWLHYDVMDGHFVPNLTFGPDILKAFRKLTDCELDVHLMITDPETYAPVFIEAGAQWLTFHYEAMENAEACRKLAKQLRQWGVKQDFDLVLVMSVEPGFGGQQFDPSALEKIAQLRAWAQAENVDLRIEVDGGINAETGKLCTQAGADVLVAGSYIFKNNIVDAVDSLC